MGSKSTFHIERKPNTPVKEEFLSFIWREEGKNGKEHTNADGYDGDGGHDDGEQIVHEDEADDHHTDECSRRGGQGGREDDIQLEKKGMPFSLVLFQVPKTNGD